MEQVLKNANISILSNFLAIFLEFLSRYPELLQVHAKFQINWTIQTVITYGGGGGGGIPICKKPGLFSVKKNFNLLALR